MNTFRYLRPVYKKDYQYAIMTIQSKIEEETRAKYIESLQLNVAEDREVEHAVNQMYVKLSDFKQTNILCDLSPPRTTLYATYYPFSGAFQDTYPVHADTAWNFKWSTSTHDLVLYHLSSLFPDAKVSGEIRNRNSNDDITTVTYSVD